MREPWTDAQRWRAERTLHEHARQFVAVALRDIGVNTSCATRDALAQRVAQLVFDALRDDRRNAWPFEDETTSPG